jgi:hypothetical protein
MKKTLRITLLLCLVVAVMLTTSSCLGFIPFETTPQQTTPEATSPENTTPEATTPEETTPEETTPQEEPDPNKPEGAVLVDSLGGKNAAELLETFATEFATAQSYDWSAITTLTEEGFSMTQTIEMKLCDGEFSIFMDTAGTVVEIYYVDDTLFMNSFGEKMQIPADSIDETLGDGALEDLFNMSGNFEISDEELIAATNAKIYLLDGEYIVTLRFFDILSEVDTTSKFYFNAAGELTKAESTSDVHYTVLTVHSYNKPVTVNPPADADEYPIFDGEDVITPEIPTDEDEIYAFYCDLCTYLQEDKYFWASIDIPSSQYIGYEIAGANKYFVLMDAESTVEQWLIDGKGYVTVNKAPILEAPVDETFLQSFASIESLFPINVYEKDEIQNLRCNYDNAIGEIVLKFEYTDESGELVYFCYAIAVDGSYIDVTLSEESITGALLEAYSCLFVFDPDLEITLPEE